MYSEKGRKSVSTVSWNFFIQFSKTKKTKKKTPFFTLKLPYLETSGVLLGENKSLTKISGVIFLQNKQNQKKKKILSD